MKILVQWATNHQLAFSLLLFCLGCVVSIYSGFIRRFLSIPPQRLSIWILKSRLLLAENQLQRLEQCHNNFIVLFSVVMRPIILCLFAIFCLVISVISETLKPPFRFLGNFQSPSLTWICLILMASIVSTRLFGAITILLNVQYFSGVHVRLKDKVDILRNRIAWKNRESGATIKD